MARGQINGKKILVTGFRKNNDSSEEIYKVTAFGTSTAEASAGSNVDSNTAIIFHEKHAWIAFSGNCNGSTLCNGLSSGCLLYNTKNIKPGTLTVSQYPSFIESYRIEEVEEGLYRLEFCRYPSYGGGSSETFIVAGEDIYGNIIFSDGETVAPQDATQGTIDLFYDSPGNARAVLPSNSTEVRLNYEASAEIKTATITIGDTSGNVTGVNIQNEGYIGFVTVRFPANNSQSFESEYTVTIRGKDIYGDIIYSNEVTIVQNKKEDSSRFYILGNDIEYNETTGEFVVYHPTSIDADTIQVSERSSTITGVQKEIEGSIVKFLVTTDENVEPTQKELSIIVTGRTTTDGTIMTISGTIYQKTGSYLLISGRTDYPSLPDGDTPVDVEYFNQTHSFKYTAFGLSDVSASGDTTFRSAGGSVSVNKSTKTVSLTFPKNESGSDRVYKITVYGNDSSGRTLKATYTFTHIGSLTGAITLLSGTSENGEIEYNQHSFDLSVNIPEDIVLSTVGVGEITSDHTQFKIYLATLSADKRTLTCMVYENTLARSCKYTIDVSGKTADNRTRYSNKFTVRHKGSVSESWIEFSPTSKEVRFNDTTVTANFNYNDLDNITVEFCTSSDGSSVSTSGLSYSNGSGSVVITFTSNPTADRTITLSISGKDGSGRTVVPSMNFKVIQPKEGGGGGGDGIYDTYKWGNISTVPKSAARPATPELGRAILVGPSQNVTMNVNVNPPYSSLYKVKWGKVNQGAGIGHGNPPLGSTSATLVARRPQPTYFTLYLVNAQNENDIYWAGTITLMYDENR